MDSRWFLSNMKKQMSFFCGLFGMCPLKWNPHRELFQVSRNRFIYSTLLTIIMAVVDPLSFVLLMNSFNVFDNASTQTYAYLVDYCSSYLALLVIHVAQSRDPCRLAKLCNEWRRLYMSIDQNGRRRALNRFAKNRAALSMVLAGLCMASYIYCINFLTDKPITLLTALGSLIASLPTVIVTLFLVIYNTTMYMVFEAVQQISRQLQSHMDTLHIVPQTTPCEHSSLSEEAGRQQRLRGFRSLKHFCDITEKIDALAVAHKDIFEFVRSFNRTYGLAMLVFLVNVFCAVVSQTFFFYFNVAVSVRRNSAYEGGETVLVQFTSGNVFYAFLVTVQMFLVIQATSAVIGMARNVSLQLHQVVSPVFDARLKQSVSFCVGFPLRLES